ncbi:MAG TPA: SGNH/GDSL hydrolase family protein, partial [Edaphobacter sp.]|nr:SGNH/GDSL hydrolase family protein [Edaphobacter sp.]
MNLKPARKNLSLAILFLLAWLPAAAQTAAQTWVATWAASQQIPEPRNALPSADLEDATLRQIVHLSLGGATLRVHLSNAFGTEPLHFASVHIARPLSPSSPAIDPASDKALTFSGSSDVTVPAGAEYISDPIAYPVAALSNLAVTFHVDAAPARQTGHPGSRATSYYVHGDQVAAADL